MVLTLAGVRRSQRFDSDLKSAPVDVVQDVTAVLKRLLQNPRANSLRMHSLKGYPKPTIYKIDVRADRSWQITMELDGDIALLLRLSTHKELDRSPR